MTQEEELPVWWIEILAVQGVADPDRPGVLYARGSVIKVNWPRDYLKELWLNGKAVEVQQPAWASNET